MDRRWAAMNGADALFEIIVAGKMKHEGLSREEAKDEAIREVIEEESIG